MSGNYGFRSLPGLRDYELNLLPASHWCPGNGETNANFAIRIEDVQRRFLPQVLRLCLPKEDVLEVPLFSSPARPPSPGMAVIRGEVRERTADRPAAWAVLTATVNNDKAYVTVADERGMFMFLLPNAARIAPGPSLTGPMDQYAWPVIIQVNYQPGGQELIPGLDVPHIRSILNQGAVALFDTLAAPAANITRSLHFGVELVVTTQDESRLWLSI